MKKVIWALLACVVSCALADEEPIDTFRSEIAQIEVTKPHSWHYQSLQSAVENRARVKMKDEEFGEAMRQLAAAPLFIATKHEEPYDSLNPTIQLVARPAQEPKGHTSRSFLDSIVPVLKQQFSDFVLQGEIEELTVGGQDAAKMTATFTLITPEGENFPAKSTIVIVLRGVVLYQLGFAGPATGDDAIEAEIDQVLATVKFLE